MALKPFFFSSYSSTNPLKSPLRRPWPSRLSSTRDPIHYSARAQFKYDVRKCFWIPCQCRTLATYHCSHLPLGYPSLKTSSVNGCEVRRRPTLRNGEGTPLVETDRCKTRTRPFREERGPFCEKNLIFLSSPSHARNCKM